MSWRVALLFTVLSVTYCQAALILNSPIPVNGQGSFYDSFPGDNYFTLSLSGSNGADTVSLFFTSPASSLVLSPAATSYSGNTAGCCGSGAAVVDGVGSGSFSFSTGNGTGHLSILDNSGILLASADLIGYVGLTSFSGTTRDGEGTFVIKATPEANTFFLFASVLLISLTAVTYRRLRRSATIR